MAEDASLRTGELGHRAPRSRKPVYIVGAMLAVGLGVVGAGLYARGGSSDLVSRGGTPLIKAADGPSKVQPASPGGVEVPNQDSAVLDKSAAGKPAAPVRVVSREEQPVDLAQVAKTPAAPAGTAQPATLPTPFPEPKKVKTVSVRPDGSLVGDAASASAPGTAPAPIMTTQPRAGGPVTPSAAAATPQQKPATLKTTARVQTTPKPEAAKVDAAPAGGATDGATEPMQLGGAKPRPGSAAAPVKPVKVASNEATASTASPASGGGFAVQLAAPTSEQEARDASTRIQRKFAGELGSYKPTVRKAEAGDKTVYRVRVGNLSRDDAAALCTKLKAGGGECFVAKN